VVFQSCINNYYDFFDSSENYTKILEYANYEQYHNQSRIQKLSKTFKFTFIYLKRKSYSRNKKDLRVIYCHELFPLCLALLLKTKNEKIIFHQFEVLNNKKNLLDSLSYFWIKRKNHLVDIAIFPEENRAKHFLSQLKNKSKLNSFILPNSNNNITRDSLTSKAKRDKIIVTHIGAVGSNHNIINFIEALSHLDGNQYEFRFIGRLTDEVVNLIKESNLSSVKLFGQLKHNELEKLYLETDIGVILYRDVGINYRFCAPNKLYEYWSYGIPVLGDKLPGLQSVFNEKYLGELVDMTDSANISNGIIKLSKQKNKKAIRTYFDKHYKLDNFLSELDKKLQRK
jgi:glycosyltransferase involved in cell wall biosynthesis